MKLLDIKKTLMNVIQVNTLLSEANRIKISAEDQLAPVLSKLAKSLDGKLSSPASKSIVHELSRGSTKINESKLFENMLVGTEVIIREAGILEKSLEDDTIESVFREAINVKEAQIVQFITLADYFIETCRSISVVIQEAEVYHLRGVELERSAQNYIQENFTPEKTRSMAQLIGFFGSQAKSDLISNIYALPDIKVDDNTLITIQSTEGMSKIDPAGFNPLNIINPTYLAFTAQKIWSEIKFSRLDKAEREITYLELRHQELTLLREGKENPALERKIGKYQDEIQVLRAKIKRIRARLG